MRESTRRVYRDPSAKSRREEIERPRSGQERGNDSRILLDRIELVLRTLSDPNQTAPLVRRREQTLAIVAQKSGKIGKTAVGARTQEVERSERAPASQPASELSDSIDAMIRIYIRRLVGWERYRSVVEKLVSNLTHAYPNFLC